MDKEELMHGEHRQALQKVSETKWKGSGAKDIEDFYAIYSGFNEGRARAGVAVVLSEQLRRYVKSWKCVNERMWW